MPFIDGLVWDVEGCNPNDPEELVDVLWQLYGASIMDGEGTRLMTTLGTDSHRTKSARSKTCWRDAPTDRVLRPAMKTGF